MTMPASQAATTNAPMRGAKATRSPAAISMPPTTYIQSWPLPGYLARSAVKGQQTSRSANGAAANLFAPVDAEHDEGAHGDFDGDARTRSAQLALTKRRAWLGAGAAAAFGAVVALGARRFQRSCSASPMMMPSGPRR